MSIRSEIIHRDAHAERFQVAQHLLRACRPLQEEALGHLEFETVGLQSGLLEHRTDDIAQASLLQLRDREIDSDAEGQRPARSLAAGLTEHPLAEWEDRPCLLCQRYELRRRNRPAGRMGPSQSASKPQARSAAILNWGW